MTQFYSDPSREVEPHALPDAEVFYAAAGEFQIDPSHGEEGYNEAGYYFWFCFPGCIPDSDPSGPYPTAEAAIKACREMYGD